MDFRKFVEAFRQKGQVSIQEGNGKTLTFLACSEWTPAHGTEWVVLLYDIFQIRGVGGHFSEVSLDIVDFASKPTIYHVVPGYSVPEGLREKGKVRFSLIRDKEWNPFLFQLSDLVLCQTVNGMHADFSVTNFFPLLSPNLKEMELGLNGEVTIIKG